MHTHILMYICECVFCKCLQIEVIIVDRRSLCSLCTICVERNKMRCDVEVVVSYCCKSRVVQVTCVYFIHYQITQVTRRKIQVRSNEVVLVKVTLLPPYRHPSIILSTNRIMKPSYTIERKLSSNSKLFTYLGKR